ncbi:GntR family transcriptional regulator [Vibrio hannami]|uniref:GntR family transcriptional regulator n=1 Tax=Vibrio hannami TaxID=2717094 RepID=UPI00240F193A|nr:GntR family transcriptional regulator [Vibrio hannami]MDG3085304.1 GntR family transcriptional regulator [Vibrio hannami]
MVKYLEIYQTIRTRIADGAYKCNDKLPDGKSFAREFECSELTIKKALDILVKEGFVVRKRGVGSFVKRPLSKDGTKNLYGTKYKAESEGWNLNTHIVNYSVEPATAFLAEKLNCEDSDMLYHVIRARYIDDEPIAIEDIYMPIDIVTGLSKKHIENSIYEYITQVLQLKIHSSMIEVTITDAEENDAKHLGLSKEDKIVNVEQVAYLDNGDIFEYSNVKHVCEKYRLSTSFVRM